MRLWTIRMLGVNDHVYLAAVAVSPFGIRIDGADPHMAMRFDTQQDAERVLGVVKLSPRGGEPWHVYEIEVRVEKKEVQSDEH